jgi:hypothetical protein
MAIIFDGTQGITSPGGDTSNTSHSTPIVKSPSALVFQTNGSTEAMRITTSQNVGIGTTTPGYQVHIRSADPRIALDNSTYGTWFTSAGWTGADDYSIVEEGVAERLRITNAGNLMFNSGYGSVATAYGCRAWVNFDGNGVIRASGNVSSVTQNGTGDYTINFTTAMPDANYAVTSVGADVNVSGLGSIGLRTSTAPATGSVRVGATDGAGSAFNNSQMHFAIFR